MEPGDYEWDKIFNNSQKGSKIGYTYKPNEATTIGVEFVYSLTDSGAYSEPGKAFKCNQFRYIFNLPMSFVNDRFTVLSNFNIKTNHFSSANYEERDHMYATGIDIGLNPVDCLGMNFSFGIGGFSNASIEGDSIIDPLGMVVGIIHEYQPIVYLFKSCFDVYPPYGKYEFDIHFSQGKDRALSASNQVKRNFMYYNTSYAMPIKKLVIQPRFRFYHYFNSKDDKAIIKLQPELILKAMF